MDQKSCRAALFSPRDGWRLWRDRRAVTAIEYCIIAGIIAVLIVGGVAQIGFEVKAPFVQVSGAL